MATKTQDKPRTRRLFIAGKERGRAKCTNLHHFGPFSPRPDIRHWLAVELEGGDDVPEQFDCARCNSTMSFRVPARQVAA